MVFTGNKAVVFVRTGEGRLEPRDISTGIRSGGFCEALSGLKEGDTVATSANFLLDSESSLKALLDKR